MHKTESPRTIIYPGKGPENHANGTKITFHFKITKVNTDGTETVIDDSKSLGIPMELIIGKQFKLIVMEECLKSMRLEEVSKFNVHKSLLINYPFMSKCYRRYAKKEINKDKNTNHDHDDDDNVNGDTNHHCCGVTMKQSIGFKDLDDLIANPVDLVLIMEVIKVEPPEEYEKEIWQMNEEEQFESIIKFKELGNDYYKKQMYSKASDYYRKALGIVEQLLLREKPDDDEWNKLDIMKVPLLCNYAQCMLIDGDYYAVIEHTNEVLKRDKDNVKALFRRGKALAEVWEFSAAKKDFHRVCELDSGQRNVVNRELKLLEVKEKEKHEEEREKFSGKLFT